MSSKTLRTLTSSENPAQPEISAIKATDWHSIPFAPILVSMSTKLGKLILHINLLLLLAATSCKNKVAPQPEIPERENPPGAENKGPAIPELLYKDLGYKKGLITKDDLPFTGRAVQHHADGKLKSRYNFVNGLLDGVIEEWYENGRKSTYKLYKAGLREGITRYWDESGKPTKQVLYRNDEEVEVKIEKETP